MSADNNKTSQIDVDQWTELFRSIGLSEKQMHNWHAEFEKRHPQGHEGFLQWLKLPPERIAQIRESSRSADWAQ